MLSQRNGHSLDQSKTRLVSINPDKIVTPRLSNHELQNYADNQSVDALSNAKKRHTKRKTVDPKHNHQIFDYGSANGADVSL